jgi:para-nitrobenzyl esterase
MFHRPAADLARGRDAAGSAPTWLYEFAASSRISGTAMHCHDLPYVWDLLNAERVTDALGPRPPQWLADSLHHAWVSFVRTGNPGWQPAGSDCWGRRYTARDASDRVQLLGSAGPAAGHPLSARGSRHN